MKRQLINTMWLVATALAVTAGAKAKDFTTGGGEVLRDAQLLKVTSGTAYLAHDGGVAALPLTPAVTAAFPAAADAHPADLMKLEIEQWLVEMRGGSAGGLENYSGATTSPLLVVSVEKLAAYKKAVGEKYDRLETGGDEVFTDVAITKVNQAYIYFSHSKGAGRALISDLPAEWAERFDFSPAEAAAFIEDERAKKELAETQKLQAEQQRREEARPVASAPAEWSQKVDRDEIDARKLALERKVAEILNRYENRGRSYNVDRPIGNDGSYYSTSRRNASRYTYRGNSWYPRNPMNGNVDVSSEAKGLYEEWRELNKLSR